MSLHYRPTAGRGTTTTAKGRTIPDQTIKRLRIDFGAYIRDLRLARGLTQKQLADLVGVTDNAISDVELGNRSLSPERYMQMTRILGVDRAEFGKELLLHYDPFTYQLLWDDKKVKAIIDSIPERITDIPPAS